MIDSDKGELLRLLVAINNLPLLKKPDSISKDFAAIYFSALSHRTIESVREAINTHIRDPDRGRFFPTPSDIEFQLPKGKEAWIGAEEAWALCPKDEYSSAPMNQEMAGALAIANGLLEGGDEIAARMAFKSAYTRLVSEAKEEGRVPNWYPSYGIDKDGRYRADVKVVEMKNRLLPPEKQLSPPKHPGEEVGLVKLLESSPDPDIAKKHIDSLKKMIG